MSYILGITYGHEPAVALIETTSGQIVAALEESKISRNKRERSFPLKALDLIISNYCCDKKSIVSCHYSYYGEEDYYMFYRRYLNLRPQTTKNSISNVIRQLLLEKGIDIPVIKEEHHLCHSYAAYFYSGYNKNCSVITCDGYGDNLSATISIPDLETRKLQRFEQFCYGIESSMGLFFQSITYALGLIPLQDEWKLLGLEPQGNYHNAIEIFKGLWIETDGLPCINRELISHYTIDTNIVNQLKSYFDHCVYRYNASDVAAAAQYYLEYYILKWLNLYHEKTN